MKYVVDRIEGEFAVCETLEKVKENFSIDELFTGVKEGDYFEFVGENCVFLEKDTFEARNKNIMLLRNLFEE
ncbi:MAG: DUF3006 domain-containing protein [Oscillospiraceae bacterium]